MEIIVLSEDNIMDAKQRKHERYEELIETRKKSRWNVEYYHLAIGACSLIGWTTETREI